MKDGDGAVVEFIIGPGIKGRAGVISILPAITQSPEVEVKIKANMEAPPCSNIYDSLVILGILHGGRVTT